MSTLFQIKIDDDPDLVEELTEAIAEASPDIEDLTPRGRNVPVTEIIVALGTAGAFAGFYQIITTLLTKNLSRELAIERDGVKISLKGQSIPEMEALIEKFAPELIKQKTSKRTKK